MDAIIEDAIVSNSRVRLLKNIRSTVTLIIGVPIKTATELLGHSKISTAQIHAKVIERKASKNMAGLKEKFFQNNDTKFKLKPPISKCSLLVKNPL